MSDPQLKQDVVVDMAKRGEKREGGREGVTYCFSYLFFLFIFRPIKTFCTTLNCVVHLVHKTTAEFSRSKKRQQKTQKTAEDKRRCKKKGEEGRHVAFYFLFFLFFSSFSLKFTPLHMTGKRREIKGMRGQKGCRHHVGVEMKKKKGGKGGGREGGRKSQRF